MARNPEAEMSLVGHLTELRSRIIICLSALLLSVVGAFFFARPILAVLTAPINRLAKEPGREHVLKITVTPDGVWHSNDPRLIKGGTDVFSQKRWEIVWLPDPARKLTTTTLYMGDRPSQNLVYSKPMDPFMIMLKVALIAGILIALPILVWQLWKFIQPGLKKKEQAIVRPLLSGAIILFPIGAGFAYFMITLVLKVMQSYSVENVMPFINVFEYISLLFNMMLIFGFIFEVPLALAIGSRIGMVTPQFLQSYRRHAYVFLAIAAMVISPGTDPFTMIFALVPLVLLYEISIAISIPMARLHKRDQELEDDEDDEDEDEETEIKRSDAGDFASAPEVDRSIDENASADESYGYDYNYEEGESETSEGGKTEEEESEGEEDEDEERSDESEEESTEGEEVEAAEEDGDKTTAAAEEELAADKEIKAEANEPISGPDGQDETVTPEEKKSQE